jgi:hypothetical protein
MSVPFALTAQAPAVMSYAASKNARYKNTSSNLVDLATRLKDTVNSLPIQAQRNWQSKLNQALRVFKANHPGLKSINDISKFRLCKSLTCKLKDIQIDTTMQREPNLTWIATIIENFRAYQAQPIQVYATSSGGMGAWDGQHTSMALYLISVIGLGEKFEDVQVPINIYDILSRGEIRSNFITSNTSVGKNAGKKALDLIDLYMQMIYGVEIDNVTEPEWVDAHAKWQYIAAGNMFLTADKFGDSTQPGAISRLNEINDSSVEVVRKFSVYGSYVVALQQRSINTKEIPIIMEFLNLCEQQDISYSDEVIEDLAQHCIDLFDANFDADSVFWEQAHQANVNAYNKANQNVPLHLWPQAPRNQKNVAQGMSFLWHQFQKTWVPTQKTLDPNFCFPKQPFGVYVPAKQDLF